MVSDRVCSNRTGDVNFLIFNLLLLHNHDTLSISVYLGTLVMSKYANLPDIVHAFLKLVFMVLH